MAHPRVKSIRSPDDMYRADKIVERSVEIGEQTIGRSTVQPGWKWSVDLKPTVGTPSCTFRHLGLVLSGRMRARMDDGTEIEVGPDDVFDLPPGHDAWVVGNEPFETVEVAGIFGFGRPAAGESFVATVLITDIVDSTATIEQVGERAWKSTHSTHYGQVRRALDRYRGFEVATTGDGILATFDSPARAIRAAAAIHDGATELGLQVRVGLHTGEVEPVPGNVRGLAVHIASRVAAAAEPGETLLTSTVREMVTAEDIDFAERGAYTLKGVATPRHLWSARVIAHAPPDAERAPAAEGPP